MSIGHLVIKVSENEKVCIGDSIELVLMPNRKVAIKAPSDLSIKRRSIHGNTDRVYDSKHEFNKARGDDSSQT